MHWLMFALTVVFEVGGTTCLKLSEGFSKITPYILIFIFYGLSFAAAAMAVKRMDISYFYAVLATLGIVMVSIIGITYFKEPFSLIKMVSIGLIVIGVAGLQFNGASQ